MTIAIVRVLIPDPQIYDRAELVGDGSTVEYQLPHYPVMATSQKVYVAGVLKTEGVDYTIDDDTGVITFMVAPILAAAVVATYKHTILSDTAIQTFLTLESDDNRLAAADALDSIASNEALVQKVMRIGDLSTNGAAVANALREHAKSLRDQVAANLEETAFDIAEQVDNQFAYNEWIDKDALRNG